MAHSSAAEPEASPGARIGPGVPVSTAVAASGASDRRAGVEIERGVGGGLEEVVEAAGRRVGVVLERRQPSLAVRAEAQPLAGRAAVADRAVHLVASEDELHRPAEHARGEAGEDLRAR